MVTAERDAPVELCRHAIGTPLAAIRAATELLLVGEGGPLNRSGRELLAAVSEALRDLEHATDLLVRLASATDRAKAQPQSIRLGDCIGGSGLRIRDPEGLMTVQVRAAAKPLGELLLFLAPLAGPEARLERRSAAGGMSALAMGFATGWPFSPEAGEGLLEERLLCRLLAASGGTLVALDRRAVTLSWPVVGAAFAPTLALSG